MNLSVSRWQQDCDDLSPIVCRSQILCSPRSSLALERSGVLDWRRTSVSCGAVHRRHISCPRGHVSVHAVLDGLPVALNGESVSVKLIDAMDRSVEEMVPDPPAW